MSGGFWEGFKLSSFIGEAGKGFAAEAAVTTPHAVRLTVGLSCLLLGPKRQPHVARVP